MAQPAKYDLKLYRGDSYEWRFQLWENLARTAPADLAGATVLAEFRDRPNGAVVVEFACTITEPNLIDVVMDKEQWADAPKSGSWDLEVTFADGRRRTVVNGKVAVTADVTGSDL